MGNIFCYPRKDEKNKDDKINELQKSLIGLTLNEAEKAHPSHYFRVAYIDGNSLFLTMDYCPSRINLKMITKGNNLVIEKIHSFG